MTDPSLPSTARSLLAVAGSAVLSFVALGLLWTGVPWSAQAFMAAPFFLMTYLLARGAPEAADKILIFVLCGATPLGQLMMRFRDKNDSHLLPVLIVLSWAAGAALGWFLGKRRK